MKVLLITTKLEDYLQDSVIHGFKTLFGKNAYDEPVKQMLYNDFDKMDSIRGNGFTLYGLLDKALKPAALRDVEKFIENGFFDKIVFTSIFRQYDLFYKLYPSLKKQREKVWIIDGEDSDMLFPYLGNFLKKPFFWRAARPHQHFSYFKREITADTIRSYHYRLIPLWLAKRLSLHKNIHEIAFSIPEEKVIKIAPVKEKQFTEHIVDKGVADNLPGKNVGYAFSTEAEYYADIQRSKFGVTTKRAGWDCLRHYEIAANGAVMCFKDLGLKPVHCAPHDLVDGYNCIGYHNYQDLMEKISKLSDDEYTQLQTNSLLWVNQNTTVARIKQLLNKKYEVQP